VGGERFRLWRSGGRVPSFTAAESPFRGCVEKRGSVGRVYMQKSEQMWGNGEQTALCAKNVFPDPVLVRGIP